MWSFIEQTYTVYDRAKTDPIEHKTYIQYSFILDYAIKIWYNASRQAGHYAQLVLHNKKQNNLEIIATYTLKSNLGQIDQRGLACYIHIQIETLNWMLLVEIWINFVVTTVHLLTTDDMMEQRIFILHKYIQQLHVDIYTVSNNFFEDYK